MENARQAGDMSKFLVVLFMLFAGLSASAMPSVGDFVEFEFIDTRDGEASTGVLLHQLVDFSAETGFFTDRVTIVRDGLQKVTETQVAAGHLLNDETINDLLKNCKRYQGVRESLTTKAGTFDACAVPLDNGTIWFAQVPFGVIKRTITEPDRIYSSELVSFRKE